MWRWKATKRKRKKFTNIKSTRTRIERKRERAEKSENTHIAFGTLYRGRKEKYIKQWTWAHISPSLDSRVYVPTRETHYFYPYHFLSPPFFLDDFRYHNNYVQFFEVFLSVASASFAPVFFVFFVVDSVKSGSSESHSSTSTLCLRQQTKTY